MKLRLLSPLTIFSTVTSCLPSRHFASAIVASSVLITTLSTPSLASSDPIESTLPGFSNHVQMTRYNESLKVVEELKQRKDSLSGGGWNGSGGGGGLACFESKQELEDLLQPIQGPDGRSLRKNAIPKMRNWTVLDLFDFVGEPDWPNGDFDPNEFMRTRIQTRLGRTMPVLATYLINTFNATLTAPTKYVVMAGFLEDIGMFASEKKIPENCGYMQWIVRPQNTKTKEPVFALYVNKPLDEHLRKILSPRDYKIQRSVLNLHEAVYALLLQEGHPDSANVRSLIDLLLMDEKAYSEHVYNPRVDGAFWNVWVRQAFPILRRSTQAYDEFRKTNGSWTQPQEAQWNSYRFYLHRLDFVLAELGEQISKGVLSHIPSIGFSNPNYVMHDEIFFYLLLPVFTSTLPAPLKSVDIWDAFYIVATELEARRKIDSVQRLALLDPANSEEWTKACQAVQDLEKEWRQSKRVLKTGAPNPLGPDLEKSVLMMKKAVGDAALQLCQRLQRGGQ